MLLGVRLALFILSMVGTFSFLVSKWNVRIEFAPAIICASISGILFVAGILNILQETAVVMFFLGLYCLIAYSKKTFSIKYNCVIVTIWIVIIIYFAVLLKNAHFIHYDNFSHWALVLKDMLLMNRMPNYQDALIQFQSYPLGSTLFIYYVCKIVGNYDGCYLLGQVLLTISFIMPLFVFVKNKIIYYGSVVLLFSMYTLVANISIFDLLVDTIMPVAGVALFCIIAEDQRNIKQLIYEIMPILIFLVNVKNSGLFFVIVDLIYFFFKNKMVLLKQSKLLKTFFVCDILIPLMSFIVWQKHVSLVFNLGALSKHAVSVENYMRIFTGKTMEDILNISTSLFQRAFSWDTKAFQILLIISIGLLAIYLVSIAYKNTEKNILLILLTIWGIWSIYLFLLLGMYIFSMPLGEAVKLAAFDRYMNTISIFILGITAIFILKFFTKRNIIVSFFVILIFGLPLTHVTNDLSQLYIKQEYQLSDRYRFQSIIEQNGIKQGKSYCIYQSKHDAGYLYYLARYELWSNDVKVLYGEDVKDSRNEIGNYDYFIVWDQDEILQKNLTDEIFLKNNVIICY